MNALEIVGLYKKRNNFQLKDINLTLPKGYILGYVGENGSGKTTTIKSILNLLKMDRGQITVFGVSYQENPEAYLERIGYISDECIFPSQFRFKDLIKTYSEFYKSFDTSLFLSYCRKWSLPEDTKISQYSKGMQIRLMFASILARDTKLLILDEATSGLDPVIRNDILELLQEYIQDGEHSVFFSTHIMSDLEQIADYICFIDKGQQVFFDTVETILETHRIIKGSNDLLDPTLKKMLIGFKTMKTGFEGLISSSSFPKLSSKLLIERPSMEQLILLYIKGNRGAWQ